MKISEQWLREWVTSKLSVTELADCLTMAGLEVNAIEPLGQLHSKIVVGKIIALAPHPNADRLRLCQVDVGRQRPLPVVCGAANAKLGIRAPLALVGAKLPDGTEIRKTEIRGVSSSGMLCSGAELGIEDSVDGLLVLDPKAKPGESLNENLQLDDHLIELDLTPNRGDCLSIAGVAREIAALTGARLRNFKTKRVPAVSKKRLRVRLAANHDCPRYAGRVLKDIRSDAITPRWLQERLRRSGIRRVSPVVDVTNYVMLELGQPMHAFDLERIQGGITVRQAKANERLTLLDGKAVKPETGTLLIADETGPLALAGIMGGAASAVNDRSRHIFLESAYFSPSAIAGRARRLGLQTDSAYRFERGVDPGLQEQAIQRATELLVQIVGGRPGPIVVQEDKTQLPKRNPILLRRQRLSTYLGSTLPDRRVSTILTRLGMSVRQITQGWQVKPPAYRFDIEREVDVIEEVLRVFGYDHIPNKAPVVSMAMPAIPEAETPTQRFYECLIQRDYQEIITYSFVDDALQSQLGLSTKTVSLANPLSSELAVMRTSLWPGLLQALRYNLNRQQERARLFEVGGVFWRQSKDIVEETRIAGVITGTALPAQWGISAREGDFFDIKGDVEALLALSGLKSEVSVTAAAHPALHPRQTARITLNRRELGWVGQLNPDIQAEQGLATPVFLFELRLLPLKMAKIPLFRPISRYPSIRRDLALVVDEQIPAKNVLDCVSKVAGKLLSNLELFDEYRGEGIDSGRKSLALSLTFQDSSRTLKEEQIDALVDRVLGYLKSELGVTLRK